MIVLVLSDTHLEFPDVALEKFFNDVCLRADVLLHCGDMVGEETWAYFNTHPALYAVQGNCDLPPLRGALPPLWVLELEGFRIGMGHGWGPRSQVGHTVASQFSDVDLVCYGHTHIRDWHRNAEGVWLLNPGSVFWPRDGEGGFARLTLRAGRPPAVEWCPVA